MKEINRYYLATYSTGTTLSFRNDNLDLARDHAEHCGAVKGNVGDLIAVVFIGREEPVNCGVWQHKENRS